MVSFLLQLLPRNILHKTANYSVSLYSHIFLYRLILQPPCSEVRPTFSHLCVHHSWHQSVHRVSQQFWQQIEFPFDSWHRKGVSLHCTQTEALMLALLPLLITWSQSNWRWR
jgi:hypothetical protein